MIQRVCLDIPSSFHRCPQKCVWIGAFCHCAENCDAGYLSVFLPYRCPSSRLDPESLRGWIAWWLDCLVVGCLWEKQMVNKGGGFPNARNNIHKVLG